jgi:2-polyprenyl-6-methoxyphenol hydroxylase-like FAD-dependent oxidoreductase
MSSNLNSRSNEIALRTETQPLNFLVSGASFAGLTTAFWMNRLGYKVTVVEVAKGLKMGGSPVDIKDLTVGIMARMGLLERIQASSLKAKAIDFLDVNGTPIARLPAQAGAGSEQQSEYEIERDTLLQMMFEAVEGDVEFLFDDRVTRMEESEDDVAVTFKSGTQRSFSLVFGCDGNHSSVRKLHFGEETLYSHSLQNYFSIVIVDKLLIKEDTAQMYNTPGKAMMLNAYNNKTDIIFCFHSEAEIPYSYRDQQEQKNIILQQFRDVGWRASELLEETVRSGNFYFDKMCQIRMPSWTKGRVALVGDAAYCASPAAGMGGSLAIIGATALADAFTNHPADFAAAFQEYNENLRPFVEDVQAQAVNFGIEMFVPSSKEALQKRNAHLGLR